MDPERVLGKGGVLEFLVEAKEEGLTRFVGISGDSRSARFLEALRWFEIDVVMCAVNVVDRHTYDFETTVFPLAAERGAARRASP